MWIITNNGNALLNLETTTRVCMILYTQKSLKTTHSIEWLTGNHNEFLYHGTEQECAEYMAALSATLEAVDPLRALPEERVCLDCKHFERSNTTYGYCANTKEPAYSSTPAEGVLFDFGCNQWELKE